ncbi:hypothetical protein GAY28_17685, partial [Azospirillum brasilense]|nr:hypothetical protein [Azospirillum brasilense]
MTRLIHLLLALCLLGAGTASAGAAEDGQPRPLVRIVTNGFVLPGKLARLARFADEAGVALGDGPAATPPRVRPRGARGARRS